MENTGQFYTRQALIRILARYSHESSHQQHHLHPCFYQVFNTRHGAEKAFYTHFFFKL